MWCWVSIVPCISTTFPGIVSICFALIISDFQFRIRKAFLLSFFVSCGFVLRFSWRYPFVNCIHIAPVPSVGGVFLRNVHLSGVPLATLFAPTHDTRAWVPRSCARHRQLLSILSSSTGHLDFRCKYRCWLIHVFRVSLFLNTSDPLCVSLVSSDSFLLPASWYAYPSSEKSRCTINCWASSLFLSTLWLSLWIQLLICSCSSEKSTFEHQQSPFPMMGIGHPFALPGECCPLYVSLVSVDSFLRPDSWYVSLTSEESRNAPSAVDHPIFLCQTIDFRCEYACWSLRVLRRSLFLSTSHLFRPGGSRPSFCNIQWMLFMVRLSGILPTTFFAPTHDTRAWVPKVVQGTIGCWAFHLHLRDLLTFVVTATDVPFAFFGRACSRGPANFSAMRGVSHLFVPPRERSLRVMEVFFLHFFAAFLFLITCQQFPSSRLMIHEPDVRKCGEFTLHTFASSQLSDWLDPGLSHHCSFQTSSTWQFAIPAYLPL